MSELNNNKIKTTQHKAGPGSEFKLFTYIVWEAVTKINETLSDVWTPLKLQTILFFCHQENDLNCFILCCKVFWSIGITLWVRPTSPPPLKLLLSFPIVCLNLGLIIQQKCSQTSLNDTKSVQVNNTFSLKNVIKHMLEKT